MRALDVVLVAALLLASLGGGRRAACAAAFSGGAPLSDVAACFSGEMRTFARADVRAHLLEHLVAPLRADVFLALSPEYTRSWHAWEYGVRDATPAEVATAVASMRPIAHVVATNAHFANVSLDALYGADAVGRVQLCKARHCLEQSGVSDWGKQLCCLRMIEAAETRRGTPYAWVVRMRPDARVAMAVDLRRLAHTPRAYIGSWDFAAVYPRPAATLALALVQTAFTYRASTCFADVQQARALRTTARARAGGRAAHGARGARAARAPGGELAELRMFARSKCAQCVLHLAGFGVYGKKVCEIVRDDMYGSAGNGSAGTPIPLPRGFYPSARSRPKFNSTGCVDARDDWYSRHDRAH
ncbi:hypothetical protein KFE25_000313 [Diacronema lutheri]|uniref:DNA-directed DNA polymerase n=1 Tax=Diacronema lutheri TaxID=2081491 RepID=A0A8J5XRC5_DIALT|nr:hypothetical protein KFE25_000313 [Diacronema lutheri]